MKWTTIKQMKLNQVDSYRRMRTATDFSDVTLVCEDSRQIYAHRVILASSSSFFQNVLTKVMHSHPLIFLRGVPHSQLSAIMDFIYLGQAEIRPSPSAAEKSPKCFEGRWLRREHPKERIEDG